MIEESLVPTVEHCERLEYFGKEDWKDVRNVWREYSLAGKSKWICCINDDRLAILSGTVIRKLPAPTVEELIAKFDKEVKIKKLEKDYHVEYELMPNQGMFNIKESLADALADLWVQLRKRKSI